MESKVLNYYKKSINKLKNNRVIDCLLQIYIAKEDTKFGLDQAELDEILASNEFQLKTFMRGRFNGNGNFTDNNDQIKSEFTYLKSIFDKTKN
jgi:uncharacterized pyridoxal phosphate-containing UPF0001 family protein